jgi:hypothetical protein
MLRGTAEHAAIRERKKYWGSILKVVWVQDRKLKKNKSKVFNEEEG